jgi:hypothetical protein
MTTESLLDLKPSNNGHASTPAETPINPTDPFDPARLRMTQDFAATLGVKKHIHTVPVRKPDKAAFVRVHPDPDYRLPTGIIELKEEREIYLVSPDVRDELATESTFGMRLFFTAMTRQNVLFLWPVRLPGPDGKVDEWSRSAMEAAELASKSWVRVQSNMSLGAYECFEATAPIPDPKWPDMPFRDILKTAFKDKHIDSLDHPVLQRLRGEI